MEQRKLEELYNLVIYEYVLNDKILLSKGFTKEDINFLLSKKFIIEIEPNKYEVYDTDKLHKYGIRLLRAGKIKEANICFKKCHKINPKGRRINLQMLLAAVRKNDYEEALKIYQTLENTPNEKYQLDNNLYLYLLNLITNLPLEYTERVRDFKYEDLTFHREIISKDENKVRIAIYQNKLPYACKLLNDIMAKKNDDYSLKYELLKILIYKAADAERDFKSKLLKLTKNEEYKEIIKILRERSNTKKLNKVETYILLISYAITNILETKIVPEKSVSITYDMYTALMGNNFELAKEINLEHYTLTETNPNADPINILLEKILELIKTLEETNKKINQPQTQFINTQYDLTELDREIIISEELAYYIKSQNISLNEGIKKLGLIKEQAIMIKLVYIRDYYIEGNNELADKLLEEIETKEILTPLIISFINKIKNYKETNLTLSTTCYTKKRKI